MRSDQAATKTFVRMCDSAVTPTRSTATSPGTTPTRVVIGPTTFFDVPPSDRYPRDSSVHSYKVLLKITGYHPVTISVPAAERATVALFYDPATFTNGFAQRPLSAGERSVTFQPCMNRTETYFNGGLQAPDNECVTLHIAAGSSTWTGRLPIGSTC
jgi:hypothetical protein